MNIKAKPIKEDQTDEAIKEYNKDRALINKYKLDLSKKETEMKEKHSEIKKLQSLNDIKDKDIQLLKQTIKDQDALINTMKDDIQNNNKRVQEMTLEIIEKANTITQLKEELNNKKITQGNENQIEVSNNTSRSKKEMMKQLFPTGTNDTTKKKKYDDNELSSMLIFTLSIDGISSNEKVIVKMLQVQIIKTQKENEALIIQNNKINEESNIVQFHYQSIIKELEDQIKAINVKNKILSEKNNKNKGDYSYFNKEKIELEDVILKQEEKLTESNQNSKKLLTTITKQNKEIEESRRYNSNLLDIISNLQQINQKLKFKRANEYKNQLLSFQTQVTQLNKGKSGKINLSPIISKLKIRKRRLGMEQEKQLSNSVGNVVKSKIDNEQKNTIENSLPMITSLPLENRRRKMFISNSVNDIQEKEKVEEFKELMNILADEVKKY